MQSHDMLQNTINTKTKEKNIKDMTTQPDMAKSKHQFHFEPCKEV